MSLHPPTPKQARILWLSLTTLAITVLLALIGFFLWALGWLAGRLSAVLLPVVLALILAYVLDPVVEFLVRKKIPRVWAILLVFLVGFMAVAGVLGSVIPGMVRESRKLIADLPKTTEKLRSKAENFMENSRLSHLLPASWHDTSLKLLSPSTNISTNHHANTNATFVITNVPDEVQINEPVPTGTDSAQISTNNATSNSAGENPASDIVMKGLRRLAEWIPAKLHNVTSWIESSIGFVLLPICLFYFLLEKQKINRSWANYLPIKESKAKEEMVFILHAINECMIVFFRGQVLVALCVGTLLAIGYLVLGLNYAVLLGLVAGVLGIVPYLGTIVSLVLALTVAGIQFGDWAHPLGVLGIAAVVKLLEDLVISPKIIGDRSGLHPLTVILAVMVGANLFGGFMGALLAIPLTAVLRTLMFRYVWKRRPHQKKTVEVVETS